jgi:hypothetical protein
VDKSKDVYHVQQLFSENRAVCEIMWTHLAERERSQMTTQYGARALHAEQLELQKRTHNMELLLLFHDSSGFA